MKKPLISIIIAFFILFTISSCIELSEWIRIADAVSEAYHSEEKQTVFVEKEQPRNSFK